MKVKKITAIMISMALAATALTGCSGKEGDQKTGTEGQSGGQAQESQVQEGLDGKDKAEAVIAERKASGNIPTVVMAYPTWSGRPDGAERIQKLLSDYTEEKIGVRVEFEIADIGSWVQNMTLMLSSGEKIDIFNSMNLGYSTMVSKGYCLNMEQDGLLETYGSGILETLNPDYVEACKIDGSIYGLLQQRDVAKGVGRYCVPVRFLDGINYDYKSQLAEGGDSILTDMKTVDEIYSRLREAYPDMYIFCPNRSTHLANMMVYDDIGNDTFGVLLDPENSLEVSNLYESQEFLDACKIYYNWNQMGYVSKDALTDTTLPQEQIRAGVGISHLCAWKPGAKQEQEVQINEDVVFFQVLGDITKSSAVTSMNWCINSACEDPVAAMQLLNLLYTDPVAATILARGEEGVDYVVSEDGFMDYPEGMDSTTCEWAHGMNWLMPNQYITGVSRGNEADVYEKTEQFNNDSVKSKAMGFSFDNSSVMAEYTALTNVYNEYIFQIILGYVEPEAALKEMNEKLYDAGLAKYMEVKQEALNRWAEENGGKS